jgi:hypothetical protein
MYLTLLFIGQKSNLASYFIKRIYLTSSVTSKRKRANDGRKLLLRRY